jgi:hypothetical protein
MTYITSVGKFLEEMNYEKSLEKIHILSNMFIYNVFQLPPMTPLPPQCGLARSDILSNIVCKDFC